MRLILALYAFGLLAYPVWSLVSPESYRATLDDYAQAATATASQLQLVAVLHWLKNAYLAFAFLLIARYIGRPEQPKDIGRAGVLLMALPIVLILFQVLAQIAMSPDSEELNLAIRLRSDLLLYAALGLSLIGISRTLPTTPRVDTGS